MGVAFDGFKEAPVGYRGLLVWRRSVMRSAGDASKRPRLDTGDYVALAGQLPIDQRVLQRGPGWIPGITRRTPRHVASVTPASKRPRLDTGDYETCDTPRGQRTRPLHGGAAWIAGVRGVRDARGRPAGRA